MVRCHIDLRAFDHEKEAVFGVFRQEPQGFLSGAWKQLSPSLLHAGQLVVGQQYADRSLLERR